MTNPPLDFQQNPVEFVKDALRVAWAATEPMDNNEPNYSKRRTKFINSRSDFACKFDPPTVIALMEDWLRLREALRFYADFDCTHHNGKVARAALAKQG